MTFMFSKGRNTIQGATQADRDLRIVLYFARTRKTSLTP